MKYACELVRDLLPLYIDGVASPSSCRTVEEHLAECTDCRGVLGQLKNDEAESAIAEEKKGVIAGRRRFFQRKSAIAGSVIAGIFMLALAVCLIVDLAAGGGLSWFFIVFASLLAAGSLIITPLMAPEDKGLWTLGGFTGSLLLLLGVCCLYTGGKWFYVAGASVLFGLSLILLPFAAKSKLLPQRLENRRGIAVLAADTVLYALMMLAIGLYVKTPRFFPIAAAVSVPVLLLIWALVAIVRGRRRIQTKQDAPVLPCAGLGGKKEKPRRLRTWEILLLALGSPLWIVLLLSAAAVLLSVYLVLWAVILSLWAAELSLAAGVIAGLIMGVLALFQGAGLRGIALLCAGAALAGLSIFLFFGCRAAARGAAALTTKTVYYFQGLFSRRRNAI